MDTKISITLALGSALLAGVFLACNQTSTNASTKAIVSNDGTSAFGLLPMRAYIPDPKSCAMSDLKRENASRLVYGPVQCDGPAAAAALNKLEAMVTPSATESAFVKLDSLRHKGSALVDVNGKSLANPAGSGTSCVLIGGSLIGAGSFVDIFSEDPTKDTKLSDSDKAQVYLSQQSMWLAARGRASGSNSQFTIAYYTFLMEGLGASPIGSQEEQIKQISMLDQVYNPCIKSATEPQWKYLAYRCDDATKNYVVNTDFAAHRDAFLQIVATKTAAFYKNIPASGRAQIDGMTISTSMSASLGCSAALGLVTGTTLATRSALPPASEPLNMPIHPALLALHGLPTAAAVFGVSVGINPGSVMTKGNPRIILAPTTAYAAPSTAPGSAAGSFGLLGAATPTFSGWKMQSNGQWVGSYPASTPGGAPTYYTAAGSTGNYNVQAWNPSSAGSYTPSGTTQNWKQYSAGAGATDPNSWAADNKAGWYNQATGGYVGNNTTANGAGAAPTVQNYSRTGDAFSYTPTSTGQNIAAGGVPSGTVKAGSNSDWSGGSGGDWGPNPPSPTPAGSGGDWGPNPPSPAPAGSGGDWGPNPPSPAPAGSGGDWGPNPPSPAPAGSGGDWGPNPPSPAPASSGGGGDWGPNPPAPAPEVGAGGDWGPNPPAPAPEVGAGGDWGPNPPAPAPDTGGGGGGDWGSPASLDTGGGGEGSWLIDPTKASPTKPKAIK